MLVTITEIAKEKGVSVSTVSRFKKDNNIFYEEKRGYFKFYNIKSFNGLQSVILKAKTRKKMVAKMSNARLVVGLIFHRNGTDWHVCEISDGYVFYRQVRFGKKMQQTRVYMISVGLLVNEILEESNEDCFVVERN